MMFDLFEIDKKTQDTSGPDDWNTHIFFVTRKSLEVQRLFSEGFFHQDYCFSKDLQSTYSFNGRLDFQGNAKIIYIQWKMLEFITWKHSKFLSQKSDSKHVTFFNLPKKRDNQNFIPNSLLTANRCFKATRSYILSWHRRVHEQAISNGVKT